MIEIIELIVLLALFFLSFTYAVYLLLSWFKYTPYYPSSSKDLSELLAAKGISLDGINFIDIGSGDGRITHFAAKNGAKKSVGIEVNPFLSLFSKLRASAAKLKNIHFIQDDALKYDFSEYSIVYLYLFPEFIEKLEEKFANELEPGTIIISKVFKLKSMEPKETYKKFHIYEIN